MAFWNDASWLAIGGYNAIVEQSAPKRLPHSINRIQSIIQSMTDRDLENVVRQAVYSADDSKYLEIWENIERFKRENFHLLVHYIGSSYWGYVGRERFPFTQHRLLCALGKTQLNKADEKSLAMYRGWTITLIMNMYGKRSEMEATRIAFNRVHGSGSGDWTREYG